VVVFIATARAGDPSIDWYLDQFRDGGIMIETNDFGKVFIEAGDIDEKLVLISRVK